MSNRKDNHINTPIEEGIHKYIEESQWNRKFALVTLVFHEYPQEVVEQMYEEIEQVLEDHFQTVVTVDV